MTILIVLVAFMAAGLLIQPAITWYHCRQLAPIEREFTRGC